MSEANTCGQIFVSLFSPAEKTGSISSVSVFENALAKGDTGVLCENSDGAQKQSLFSCWG